MRLSTERQEAVDAGFATVVGTEKDKILATLNEAGDNKVELPWVSPFGDDAAGRKTVEIREKNFA